MHSLQVFDPTFFLFRFLKYSPESAFVASCMMDARRYIRNAGPSPPRVYPAAPSGPPVPTREDIHYPHEERDERAHNPVPTPDGISLSSNGTCVLTTASRLRVVTREEVLNGHTVVVPGTGTKSTIHGLHNVRLFSLETLFQSG